MKRLKRLWVLSVCGLATLLFVLPSALASASGRPSRAPFPASPFDFPAGVACSFELAGQPVASNDTSKTFPPEVNGDVVQIVTGTSKFELANVVTGKSIVVNVSGPVQIINHPDGSAAVTYRGPTLLFFFPTDIPAGPAAYLFSGQVVANYTASGQQIIVSESGTREDVCAALS